MTSAETSPRRPPAVLHLLSVITRRHVERHADRHVDSKSVMGVSQISVITKRHAEQPAPLQLGHLEQPAKLQRGHLDRTSVMGVSLISVVTKRHVDRHVDRTSVMGVSQSWQAVVAMGLAAVAALTARIITGAHPIDDAFITFRYARNLAEGLGLVYNPGEWVLGTTTPLWAVVLGAGYRLGLTNLPWLATALSAGCDAASAALLVYLARRIGWPSVGAALVGLAWALNPMSVGFATGGMETSLFVLLALGTLSVAATRRRIVFAAGLAGFAALVRPEGALLAATVVTWAWLAHAPGRLSRDIRAAGLTGPRSNRREALGAVVAAAVPVTVGGGLFFLHYGSPIPHSVAAKQVAYQPPWPFENALALVMQAGLPGWSTYLLTVIPAAAALSLIVVGLGLLIALARQGVLNMNQSAIAWQPFAGFALLYVAFYVAVGLRGVRLFPWYLVPFEPFYLLTLAAGLASVRGWRSSWLAAVLVLWQLPGINWHQPLLPAGEDLARERLYLSVGAELADHLPTSAVVAAPEIGALGYASNLRMLDTVGLVSPAALAYYPLPADQFVTDNAIPARLITDRKPDAVVTLDAFARRSLLPDAEFQSEYRLEAKYSANVWQSKELLVFRRVDPR